MTTSLRNYWHPVAWTDEVTDQPKQVSLLGEQLVVFRNDSEYLVFKDLCIHRGTALSLGWVENGQITCAYHGWRYDTSGVCVRIPSLPEGSVIPPKARIIPYQAKVAYDMLWVALDEPVTSIPTFPDDVLNDESYRGVKVYDDTWNASAGRMIENFLDISHFAWVHEGVLGVRDNAVTPGYDIVPHARGFSYEVVPPPPGVPSTYWLYTPFTAYIHFTLAPGKHTYIFLAVSPLSETRVRAFEWIFRNHDLWEDHDDEFWVNIQVDLMGQDRRIVESQRPSEIPLDLREELHLKVPDASGMTYRRLLGSISGTASHMP